MFILSRIMTQGWPKQQLLVIPMSCMVKVHVGLAIDITIAVNGIKVPSQKFTRHNVQKI